MVRIKFAGILCMSILFASLSSKSQIISTFAGVGFDGHYTSGVPATSALFRYPSGIAADAFGNVFITDAFAYVYKVNSSGIINDIAGNGTPGAAGDGGPATAANVGSSNKLAVDAAGNLYFGDGEANKIRKITASSGIITAIAGTGICGYSGDGGAAGFASICGAAGIAIKGTGTPTVYVSQFPFEVIRAVSASGIMFTFAGYYFASVGGGYTGDGGPATSALLSNPIGLTVDPSGNVYIADASNRVIRKVNSAGIISTFAGNSFAPGNSGDGGPATAAGFYDPVSVAADAFGNVYVGDVTGHVVRKINAAGIITTCAGTGVSGYTGDGAEAALSKIDFPISLAVDPAGNLYIADQERHVVRKVSATSNVAPAFSGGYFQNLGSCISATSVSLSGVMSITDSDVGQTERWVLVSPPSHGIISGFPYTTVSTGSTLVPSGLSYIPSPGYAGNDTFKVRISDGVSVSYTTVYVTIAPVPAAGFVSGPPNVCVGATIVLTDTAAGGTWTASNPSATVVGGLVTGVTAGVDTITYSVTNPCTTTFATKVVTINPVASPGVITGPAAVCVGANITLADATPGGTWSVTNANASITGAGLLTGLIGGLDTVKYSVTLAACISAATHIVSVELLPVAPPILGPSFVCTGSNITLTNTATGTWSATTGNASVSTGGIVTGITAGIDTIKFNMVNSCGSGYGAVPMVVLPTPSSAGTITGADIVCLHESIVLANAIAGGVWSSANTTVATIAADGTVTGVNIGSSNISYSFINACGIAAATHLLNVGCEASVRDINAIESYIISPIPNHGSFTIFRPSGITTASEIIINDVFGRKVFGAQWNSGSQFPVHLDVAAGLYIVSIRAAGSLFSKKVVVY